MKLAKWHGSFKQKANVSSHANKFTCSEKPEKHCSKIHTIQESEEKDNEKYTELKS